jgi:hypothetical protein
MNSIDMSEVRKRIEIKAIAKCLLFSNSFTECRIFKGPSVRMESFHSGVDVAVVWNRKA